MRPVTVAATQMACDDDTDSNVEAAVALVRSAAVEGAQVVLLQELFATPYFCRTQRGEHFGLAHELVGHPVITRFAALAAELGVVLPISFFERAGQTHFNSIAIVDADGTVLGVYRKSHIPDGPGYQEKYYFSPGDTGPRVWDTRFGRIGVGICWDQWFPELARAMTLQGAELLFYPTAIGSEPPEPGLDSSRHWQRTMQGHAAANIVPLIASNRVGTEGTDDDPLKVTFYGTSFIADYTGAIVAEADRTTSGVITATFDLDEVGEYRARWGLFRDRRPDLYGALATLDGKGQAPTVTSFDR
jgi:N-carbamoylputrescine amidase